MKRYNRIFVLIVALITVCTVNAQLGTNSPYTRYGFGVLADQQFGHSKAMGGVGIGMRNNSHINMVNPAAYSAVDSLTFLFDMGVGLQNDNFKEGKIQTNAKNSSFDYAAAQFRLRKGLGFTIGFLPFSTVGYNILSDNTNFATDQYGSAITEQDKFIGEGSLQQIIAGIGWRAFKGLSVGANVSYLYGDIDHTVTKSFNTVNSLSSIRGTKITVRDYKLDFGVQYQLNLNEKQNVIVGATFQPGHTMHSEGLKYTQVYNSDMQSITGMTSDTLKNAFSLPSTLGLGITYNINDKLIVGADFTYQQWSKAKFFDENGYFSNRTRIAVGAEFIPAKYRKGYLNRIRYRAGAYIASPYTRIDGKDGAKEYGVSAGFGFPLFQSKSVLSISGQYVKIAPKIAGMLEENILRVNVSMTFNERWFAKWKVE